MQSEWERFRAGKLHIFISFVSKVSSLKKKKFLRNLWIVVLKFFFKIADKWIIFKNYEIIDVILLITS